MLTVFAARQPSMLWKQGFRLAYCELSQSFDQAAEDIENIGGYTRFYVSLSLRQEYYLNRVGFGRPLQLIFQLHSMGAAADNEKLWGLLYANKETDQVYVKFELIKESFDGKHEEVFNPLSRAILEHFTNRYKKVGEGVSQEMEMA